jgi:MFS family permease
MTAPSENDSPDVDVLGVSTQSTSASAAAATAASPATSSTAERVQGPTKDPHVSADGHRPTKTELWRLGIGFTFSAVVCAIPWVTISTLVLPAVLRSIDQRHAEAILGTINAVGSVVALLANIVFGALSDNTRSRFGRRTPWIVAGGLVAGISMGLIALFQGNVWMIGILYCLAQMGYNMMLAPFVACMSDRIPDANRGVISGFYGAGIAVGQTLGNYVGAAFVRQGSRGLTAGWILALVVFGLIGIVTVLIWPREKSSRSGKQEKLTGKQIAQSFIPPVGKGVADFYYALAGRTLMMAGYQMVNSYLLYIATDFIFAGSGKNAETQGAALIAAMAIPQLIVTLIAALTAGPVTDHIHMRKTPVALAACLFAVGIAMPLIFRNTTGIYLYAIIAGFGYGVYNAIDQALNVDVLPNPDQAGKDLGILNLANTLSTVLGSIFTSVIVASFKSAQNATRTPSGAYVVVFIVAIVLVLAAAALIMRIKRVK